MDNMQYQFYEGDEVYSVDGEKIGKIAGVRGNMLTVEKGWLFPTEYYIPVSAVARYDENSGVYLSVSKDQALNSGWDSYDEGTMGSTGATEGNARNISAMGGDESTARDFRTSGQTTGSGARDLQTDDTIVVPVHEQELIATRSAREAGRVTVRKRVETEQQSLDVPITEEYVEINRRTVDRDAVTGAETFHDEVIDVPLRSETVNVGTRDRVVEEIEVGKKTTQRTERVTGEVQKEVVDIVEDTDQNSRGTGNSAI